MLTVRRRIEKGQAHYQDTTGFKPVEFQFQPNKSTTPLILPKLSVPYLTRRSFSHRVRVANSPDLLNLTQQSRLPQSPVPIAYSPYIAVRPTPGTGRNTK